MTLLSNTFIKTLHSFTNSYHWIDNKLIRTSFRTIAICFYLVDLSNKYVKQLLPKRNISPAGTLCPHFVTAIYTIFKYQFQRGLEQQTPVWSIIITPSEEGPFANRFIWSAYYRNSDPAETESARWSFRAVHRHRQK